MRDKGKFTKGNKGRPAGTKNRTTQEIRDKFQMLLEGNIEKIQEDLDKLKPKERVDVLLNLANFIVPKLRATEMDVRDTTPRTEFKPIEIHFNNEN